jgi:transcriptional regulator with XRE-family HTH domain
MAAVKHGTGPWGEAIRYWLPKKNMRQVDLARVANIEEKTISKITRGFHTTTRQLEKIARAFQVPIDDVLLSPDRRLTNADRHRLINEISASVTEKVYREIEGRSAADAGPIGLDHAAHAIEQVAQQQERNHANRRALHRGRKK